MKRAHVKTARAPVAGGGAAAGISGGGAGGAGGGGGGRRRRLARWSGRRRRWGWPARVQPIGPKLQIPSSKLQRSSKFQIPSANLVWCLGFFLGAWDLVFRWSLELLIPVNPCYSVVRDLLQLQNTLRMELHAPDRQLLVLHPHDFPFLSLRRDLQTVGQRIPLNHQRMIARRRKRIRHPLEQILAVVLNQRSLAMHHPVVHNDIASEHVPDALMPKADSQRRNLRAERPDDFI